MRHTPCGCCSACLVVVQPNFRLLTDSSMRRAQQCRYFARSLSPSKRHTRLTIVRRGCKTVTKCRDSWRSHVHRTHTAQRVQSFKLQTANVRGQGVRPLAFLWGFQRGCSLWKENTPFDRQQRLRAAFPLRAVRGKNHPACKATHLYTNWCKTFRGALCQKNS